MRTGITFDVTAADRSRLETIIAAPTSPQKHVWRAKIILMSGEGLGTVAIMEATGKSKPCVWRWQERYLDEGVPGLKPTACFGLTSYTDRASLSRLFIQTDEALYEAKRVRNAIRVFHEEPVNPTGRFRISSQADVTRLLP